MVNFHQFWCIIEATNTYAVSPEEAIRLLGLSQGYTGEQLNQAYRNAALKNHPDRGGDPIAFKRIQAAYETLKSAQASSQEAPRQNARQQEAPRQNARQQEAPRQNTRQQEAPRQQSQYKVKPIPAWGGTKTLSNWSIDVMQAAKDAEKSGLDSYGIYQQMVKYMREELERISKMPNPDPDSIARKNRLERDSIGGIKTWENFLALMRPFSSAWPP